MKDKPDNRTTARTQPTYDPPLAMRLGQIQTGKGLCDVPGSGDFEACYLPGNTADIECLEQGNSASGQCLYPGNDATLNCLSLGSGFIG